MNPPDPTDATAAPPLPKPPKTNWLLILGLLLAPALLSILLVATNSTELRLFNLLVSLGGSVGCGVICAGRLACDFCVGPGRRLALTLGLSCLLVPVSLALCYVGCSAAIP